MAKKLIGSQLKRLSIEEFKKATKLPVVVLLDNIRSGYNVGAIFRNADAFRIEKIILTGITPRPPYREILKTALGATMSVDWEYIKNPIDAVNSLKEAGYKILCLEQTDSSVPIHRFSPEAEKKYAIIVGSEVSGISDELIALGDLFVEIPQFGTKHSLNVAVATGILLWEFAKHYWLR